ncbi:MAG TPA: hypothetical protein VKB36_22445 [Vicinamibacterales bacterium]|nr:hypothetical protein [Vicinamibacterales bacterium]
MFVGHFALGFAGKRAAPKLSLALLFVACQLADILWPVFVATGLETVRIVPGLTAFTPLDFVSYPYSHSLVALCLWGALLGSACWLSGITGRVSLLVAGLVVSHWILDFVSHRPDLPIYPGGALWGLGLWNSVPATLIVELLLFGAGVWLYAGATRARDAVGHWSFAGLVAFLLIAYFANVGGGPPPSVTAIYIVGIAGP